MKSFTYFDYIKCIHKLRLNAVLQLCEPKVEYNLKTEEENKKQTTEEKKEIIEILKDKTEMAKFINGFLNPKKEIKEENLIIHKEKVKSKMIKKKTPDIIYYLENQQVYFIVEEQNKIDDTIRYKMLNYCIELLQNCRREKKLEEEIQYPIVIPIVIYTGKEEWQIEKNTDSKEIYNVIFKNNEINFEFNLVETKQYSNEFLLKTKSKFAQYIIEKNKTTLNK